MRPADAGRAAAPWLALAAIALATLTPAEGATVATLPHWCWQCGALWLADAASNVLLFVPLGLALAHRGWPLPRLLAAAAAVTLAVETLQWQGIPPGRLASRADVAANLAGALVGALLWRRRGWWRAPSPTVARRLAWGWALGVGAQALATGAALAPGGSARHDSAPTLSPHTHVPGTGWFEGVTDSVRVDGVLVRRGYTGPVILATRPSPAAARATLYVRGRDPTAAAVPLLVLHDAGSWRPWLTVAQHGTAAEVTVTRRGGYWGLAMPVLALPGAFAPRPTAQPLRLAVATTPQGFTVGGRAGLWANAWTLPLSPLLGWALLQGEVRTDGAWARLVASLWLALLAFPVGWWGVQGVRRTPRALGGEGVALGAVTVGGIGLAVLLWHSALPAGGEVAQLLAWGVAGGWGALRTRVRGSIGHG